MFRFLRNKLLVLSLLISVLPLLSVSAVGYYAARYLTDITLQNQMVESADKVRAIEQWFVERKRNATDLALVVQQIGMNQSEVQKLVEAMKQNCGDLCESVLVVSKNGIIFADPYTETVGKFDLSKEAWYQDTMYNGKIGYIDIIKSKRTGLPVVGFAAPVRSGDGSIISAVLYPLSGSYISQVLQTAMRGQTGDAYLVNRDGFLMSKPRFWEKSREDYAGFQISEPMIRKIRAREKGIQIYRSYDNKQVAGAYIPFTDTQWGMILEYQTDEVYRTVRFIKIILSVIFCATLIAVVIAISVKIVRPITLAVRNITESGFQVAGASEHVSAVSQFLADGTNTQASAIQEASSSMEDIRSLTKQTAENAENADNFIKKVSTEAGYAKKSMSELIVSMEEISKAGKETSEIVKTIDGIAFQTSLLALNASIEAARAGDAGAGFSVVADEVRRLAHHAKDAAKNTSEMVSVILGKIHEGVSCVRKTDEIFIRVSESASKGSELVSGIAESSRQQSHNIDQISKAIAEVANLVHKTAANAEEASAVSEEMASQAEQMKYNVSVISAIVGKLHEIHTFGRKEDKKFLKP